MALELYRANEGRYLDPDEKFEVTGVVPDSIIVAIANDYFRRLRDITSTPPTIAQVERNLWRAESSLVAKFSGLHSVNSLSALADSSFAIADSLSDIAESIRVASDSIHQTVRPAYERISVYRKRFNRDYWLSVLTGLLGLVLMIIGFLLWYVKVQRFHDIVARRNAIVASRDI